VIEEADPGRDARDTATVELDIDLDIGLFGDPFDEALAHAFSGLVARLLSGEHAFRHYSMIPKSGNRFSEKDHAQTKS
jgi:hypothetical protein